MSELLHNTESIFMDKGYLSLYGKHYYNIPLYQRGYKWTTKQVLKLLDDIDRFTPTLGKFYCVQNITLIPQQEYFNVVDGQQRLATMVLILSCLNEKDLVRNKVRFPINSIRERTNEFINEYITNGNSDLVDLFPTWDSFIRTHHEYDHQDIYFLFHSHLAINNWFNTKDSGYIEEFNKKLKEHVKFIVNYIEDSDEVKIFGNLNSKKIFLDGADLVRAILITRVTLEESKRETDIKNIVRVNERRVRIGWQLDEINNWWSGDSVNNYFESWIKVRSSGDVFL